MIRICAYALCIAFLGGCANTQYSSTKANTAARPSSSPPTHQLTLRKDFIAVIPQLLLHLDTEKPDKNGTKQFLIDTPKVRKLLHIHENAIVDRGKNTSLPHVSLTNRAEYSVPQYTKQCLGFIKAVVTDPNWATRDIKGARETISPFNLPPMYSVIGYFSGSVDKNGYKLYQTGSCMAVYLGTYENGIIVLDQNHNGEGSIAVRKISWETKKNRDSILGGKYYRVVLK